MGVPAVSRVIEPFYLWGTVIICWRTCKPPLYECQWSITAAQLPSQSQIIFISCGHRSKISLLDSMASLRIHKSNCPISGTNCRLGTTWIDHDWSMSQDKGGLQHLQNLQEECPKFPVVSETSVSNLQAEDLWPFLELENETNSSHALAFESEIPPRLQSWTSAGPPHLRNWSTSGRGCPFWRPKWTEKLGRNR